MPPQASLLARNRGGFRLDGLTKVKATLQELPEAFRAEVADTFDLASQGILDHALNRIPVKTGKLFMSMGRNIREDGLQVSVGSGDYKAKFIEFGTEDTPRKAFLWPAFRHGARFVRHISKTWVVEAGKKVTARTKISKSAKAAQKRAVTQQRALRASR